ncbi:MAG: hypothetical protein ACJAXA_000208 [Candidatus Aldehydirespiratoraceae bacterium]|jgi:hypothetical protein
MEVNQIELGEGLAFAADVQLGTLITLRRDGRPLEGVQHRA